MVERMVKKLDDRKFWERHICKLREIKVDADYPELIIFGSPLLAVLIDKPRQRFHKYIFVEKDQKRMDILKQICGILKQDYKIDINVEFVPCDMNDLSYIPYMKECKHALVIIDPEGLEPKFTTISKLLENNCDVIITFMSTGINRVSGKRDNNTRKTLEEFIGSPLTSNDITIEDLEKIYINNIRNAGKEAYSTLTVKSKGSFEYDIIIATRKTGGDNPWLRAINLLNNRLQICDDRLNSIIMQELGVFYSMDNFTQTNNE